MKGRERVLTALNHKEPDRIPIDIGGSGACGIDIVAYKNLINYLGLDVQNKVKPINNIGEQLASVDERVFQYLGVDVRPLRLRGLSKLSEIIEKEDGFYYIDEWQKKLKMPKKRGHSFDIVEYPLNNINYSDYQWPNPRDPRRYKGLTELADYYLHETDTSLIFTGALGNGFLQMGAQLFGFERWFLMLASEPKIVEKFLDRYLEFKLDFWDALLSRIGRKVDVVSELDDLGTQNAPFISLDMYRKYIKPRQKKLFSFIKKKTNAKLFFHSDGSIYDFIPDLIEVGVDILNPIQYSAAKMDTRKLKEEFGNELVFWGGGIDTQKILPFGSKKEIRDEVKKRIDDLAPGGGFIFATVHTIQPEVPPENIVTMLEAFREHAWY